MKRYKIEIAYDGTDFSGWQMQPNAPSIQEMIEQALYFLTGSETHVSGSGRTDAGVHASCQVAHFDALDLDPDEALLALNETLPPTIRILSLEQVYDDFHARFGTKSKTYIYNLHTAPVCPPFQCAYTHHIRYPLDIDLLERAAMRFVGTHDFTTFANQANTGSASINPVRTIYSIDITKEEGALKIHFHGNGFLYKMVRNITGTLIQIATGKLPIESLDTLFEARDRREAPIAAPAKGLFLHKVEY